jgi:predicted outer membrane protein
MHRRHFVLGMLTATAALAVTRTAVAQPTPAGALPTPVYLNMATKGGLFLENTARDAFEKTGSPRVKKFARAEVVEQVNLSRKLSPYAGAMAGGAAAGPGGLIGGLVAAPLAVAGATVGAVGGVLGGTQPGAMTTDEQKAQLLSQLSAMPGGPQYDATFVAASLQGHQEAYTIHGSYAESGEDPELRRIARGALPLLRLHISQLTQMQGMMGGREG